MSIFKQGFIVVFSLMSMTAVIAQDVPVPLMVKLADSLERTQHEEAAFNKFREVLKKDPRNFYSLWKCSELCSRIGFRQPKKEKKTDYYEAARLYANMAIKVDPAQADGYYALALAMGRMAQTKSGNEKIKAVKDIRANAEKAVQINPAHARAWHVVGKWHYEVSDLNFMEKAGLKLIYGGLPPASLKEAIAAYEKARQLEPNFALNNLELAKAYHRDDEDAKAIALLKQIPGMPTRTEDDERIRAEARKLLAKLE